MWRLPLLLLAAAAWAQQPGALGFPTYLEGLEALADGDWEAAEAHFTDCIAQNVANPRYPLARAVARTLSERHAEALEDVEHTLRLRPRNDSVATVWRRAIGVIQGETWTVDPDLFPNPYEEFMRTTAVQYARGGDARTEAVGRFPEVAAWFVEIAKWEKELGPLLLQRASAQYDAREYRKALHNLDLLLAHQPDDANLLIYKGNCLVALGNWWAARKVLTKVLMLQPDNARVYLQRASVEARLGCGRRARADLAIAAKSRPEEAEARRAEVEEALEGLDVETPETTQAKVSAMRQAVADPSVPWERIVELGIAAHRSANSWRTYVDEDWQDRIREAREAGKEAPQGEPPISFGGDSTDEMDLSHGGSGESSDATELARYANEDRMALAAYEAQARLSGSSIIPPEATTMDPEDIFMAIVIRQDLVIAYERLGKSEEAARVLEEIVSLDPRIAPWDRYNNLDMSTYGEEVEKARARLAKMRREGH